MSGVWGKLITAYDQPALGAVYKIVAIEDENGESHNTIKLSNNAEKFFLPQVRSRFPWINSRRYGSGALRLRPHINYEGV